MKRIIVVLLLALLLTILFPAAVCADGATVHLTLSAPAVQTGESVTVIVSGAGFADAQALMIAPTYDGSVLEIMNQQWIIDGMVLSDFEGDDGVLAFSAAQNMNQAIAAYTFRVRSDAAPGPTEIGFTLVTQTPGQSEAVGSATLTVEAPAEPIAPDEPDEIRSVGDGGYVAVAAVAAVGVAMGIASVVLRRRKRSRDHSNKG